MRVTFDVELLVGIAQLHSSGEQPVGDSVLATQDVVLVVVALSL